VQQGAGEIMKDRKLFIFGTSDYASWAKDYFQENSRWEVVGFVVDREYIQEPFFEGLPVTDSAQVEQTYPVDEYDCYVAIGYKKMNRVREEKIRYFKDKGYILATYIDPSCRIASTVEIGENCFVMEHVALQPRVKIGIGVTLDSGVIIGHDSQISDNVYLAPGAVISGFVKVGKNTFVGANATVNDKINISEFTLVGAGAHLTKDTKQYGVYLTPHSRNVARDVGESAEFQDSFF
jgi:sugar O-acyltransferase (sialic acid O-acetyltransferase NeuD family)